MWRSIFLKVAGKRHGEVRKFKKVRKFEKKKIAAALDPSLDVAEGLFPVADAIDVWARDPPHTSVLGCPA